MSAPEREPTGLESWLPPRRRWAVRLEQLALALERPVNRLIGNAQLNPFYHTGPLAVLLFAIVGLTGIYLFFFFQYGFDASYNSVVTRIEAPIIARAIRAMHRYASGALVITTLLHAFRTLFMERFRGPRWLAWLTGIAMTFVLWLAGISGYWLVWDQRAQLINDQFVDFLQQLTPFAAPYMLWLARSEASGESWQLFLVVFGLHVLLFLLTAGGLWLHLRHLQRPRWLPDLPWIAGASSVLLIISALFPSGNLPQAAFDRLPGAVRLDPIYLYYLPLNETAWANWLWAFMWTATLIAAALPWVRRRARRQAADGTSTVITIQTALVNVIDAKCTGCTKCANDCPYGALKMVPRNDDSGHQLLAIADQSKCVGCGICVGSCDDFYAITLGDVPPERVGELVDVRIAQTQARYPDLPIKVIFTCQRHATHGAAPYLNGATANGLAIALIELPCTGAIQPTLLPRALAHGVSEVQVVGCPPNDCANREGNLWEEQRVTHERVPRLRKRYDHAPITAAWLAPDDFARALPATPVPAPDPDAEGDDTAEPDYLATREMFSWLTWRNLVVGFALLAVVMVGQIWFTGLPFTKYPAPPTRIRLLIADPAAGLHTARWAQRAGDPQREILLSLTVDDTIVYQQSFAADRLYSSEPLPLYQEIDITPGTHHLRVAWRDEAAGVTRVLADETVMLEAGQIWQIGAIDPLPGR